MEVTQDPGSRPIKAWTDRVEDSALKQVLCVKGSS